MAKWKFTSEDKKRIETLASTLEEKDKNALKKLTKKDELDFNDLKQIKVGLIFLLLLFLVSG